MRHYKILSSKKYSSSNISEKISKKEEYIKSRLGDIFTDVRTAEEIGEGLIELAAMKDARLLMTTVNYELYEKEGKPTEYSEWLTKSEN